MAYWRGDGDAIRGNPAGNRPGGPKTSQFKSEKPFSRNQARPVALLLQPDTGPVVIKKFDTGLLQGPYNFPERFCPGSHSSVEIFHTPDCTQTNFCAFSKPFLSPTKKAARCP
jgi:hypothetical protein